MRHLLVCCLPEESRTGSFSRVQDSRPPASNCERYSLQSSCGRRAAVRAPRPPCLVDLILRNLGFPARKALNHHKCITGKAGCEREKRVCSISHLVYKQSESEKWWVPLPAQHVSGVFYYSLTNYCAPCWAIQSTPVMWPIGNKAVPLLPPSLARSYSFYPRSWLR